jgi:hypothetical protein
VNPGQVAAIPACLKLLEAASYINFYPHKDSGDPWLETFYKGRKEGLLVDRPYVEIDIDRVSGALGL